MHRVSIALIHHPVIDKNGETIAAAVTALDLHDIARAARTFGAGAFYVVTPLQDQQILVRQIIDHWVKGYGAQYNPDRQAALSLIRLQPSIESVQEELEQAQGSRPITVVTSARMKRSDLSCMGVRSLIKEGRSVLLLFGTAWGIAPEVVAQADYRLKPIDGTGDYNHLAVRSAVSIILDRIAGQREVR